MDKNELPKNSYTNQSATYTLTPLAIKVEKTKAPRDRFCHISSPHFEPCAKNRIFVKLLEPKMKKISYIALLLVAAVLLCTSCTHHSCSLTTALAELNSALAMRQNYASLKEQHIAIKREALGKPTLSYEEQISTIESLIDEYNKYQLDSTIVWLNRGVELATLHNDKSKADALHLRIVELYSMAGFYSEAGSILAAIDTLGMSDKELRLFYRAAHSYHREMREYSADPRAKSLSAQLEQYYIDQLITTESDPIEQHKLLCTKFSNLSDWENTSKELDIVLPTLSPNTQEFAYFSYIKALSVGDNRGTQDEYLIHLARSARADIVSCTTDHASLSMLSEILFHKGEVEQAFEYIQVAMHDATFYNSRLRPWQVAAVLPVIEQSYRDRMNVRNTFLSVATLLISLLLVVLLIVLLQKSRQNSQIRQHKAQLEEMNSTLSEYITQLSELNKSEHLLAAELQEANTVKEQYIGLFLVICSNYIDLLKSYHNTVSKRLSQGAIDSLKGEIKNSTIIKDAEEEFYTNFDNAFLNLYPTFVEEFNSLLKEDMQFVLKNPRVLNTELRIFALIKLGIADSSRIASLLRYSVNTIYNYRAGVKNKAIISRDDFEDKVRKIGSKWQK